MTVGGREVQENWNSKWSSTLYAFGIGCTKGWKIVLNSQKAHVVS
jgi:hypothetical protein